MSESIIFDYDGFDGLEKLLADYSAKCKPEKIEKALSKSASEFVDDLLKLPKPISKIKKSGYTHLIDTFAYQMKDGKAIVGWGKYYGPMVERGTKKTKSQPHLVPTFEKNKNKYYKTALKTLGL